MTTEVLAFNKGSRHTLHEAGAANPPVVVARPVEMPGRTPPPPLDRDALARSHVIAMYRSRGLPIPAWLAATNSVATQKPDLVGAMKSLWQIVLRAAR